MHYHFGSAFKENKAGLEHGWTHYRTYAFGLTNPLGWKCPKYVEDAVERLILELLQSGNARFYEYDQEGERRYDDLRYHSEQRVNWMIDALKPMKEGEAHGS